MLRTYSQGTTQRGTRGERTIDTVELAKREWHMWPVTRSRPEVRILIRPVKGQKPARVNYPKGYVRGERDGASLPPVYSRRSVWGLNLSQRCPATGPSIVSAYCVLGTVHN